MNKIGVHVKTHIWVWPSKYPFSVTPVTGLQGCLGPWLRFCTGDRGRVLGSLGERRKESRGWEDRPCSECEWTTRPWRAGSSAGQDAHGKALIETEVARALDHLHHCPRS